jgi:hypothetical protein
MIHYHGTPITPDRKLMRLPGRHFCVSFAHGQQLAKCLAIGASVMMDNGAFSLWTKQKAVKWDDFYLWVAPHLRHPHWCVIPDVIDGGEENNDWLVASCPLPAEFAAPVWHLHEGFDRLARLCDGFPRVCFGSSGQYGRPGTDAWRNRIDDAWDMVEKTGRRPWIHMLRAMHEASIGGWPFASADSTNVARNHAGSASAPRKDPADMADRIDGLNPRR